MSAPRLPKPYVPVMATVLDIAAFPPTEGKKGARREVPGWLIDQLRERLDDLGLDWREVREANIARGEIRA